MIATVTRPVRHLGVLEGNRRLLLTAFLVFAMLVGLVGPASPQQYAGRVLADGDEVQVIECGIGCVDIAYGAGVLAVALLVAAGIITIGPEIAVILATGALMLAVCSAMDCLAGLGFPSASDAAASAAGFFFGGGSSNGYEGPGGGGGGGGSW